MAKSNNVKTKTTTSANSQSSKAAQAAAARKGGDILDFFPIKSIENGLVTFTNGKYGKVLKVGSLNISYLSVDEQISKMRQLAGVFNTISADCSILKLERKLDLTTSLNKQVGMGELLEKKYANNEMTQKGYEQRKKQIQYEYELIHSYNNDYPVMVKNFYIIIYHSSKETVLGATEDALEKLHIAKLEPKVCNDSEIKTMYYYFYNPTGRRKESFFEHEESDYKKEIMPENMEFFSNKIKTDTVYESVFSTYDYPNEVGGA
jgi:hypothetical protein